MWSESAKGELADDEVALVYKSPRNSPASPTESFGDYSLFFNAENITDTRQGRFGTVVFPPHQRS